MPTANTEQARLLIDRFRNEVTSAWAAGTSTLFNFDARSVDAGRAILELPWEEQVPVVLEAVARQVPLINGQDTCGCSGLTALLQSLLRKKLPFTGDQLEQLVRALSCVGRS